ncbi:spore coat protein U domain-containing protein [Ectopseudomonas mendocina]|uniref:Spore coat protein U domain-containing protein n=1 Tax=Ectopseudomonas mendocina TaxID=300 RepID=A0ABZ2RLE5_ECTME
MGIKSYIVIGWIFFSSASLVFAQTATIDISATILPSCETSSSISGSGNSNFGTINFGEYVSLDNVLTMMSHQGAGSIRVKCMNGQTYTIRLDGGLYGSVTTRRMANVTDSSMTINYMNRPGFRGGRFV